jgi:hypothetical protein
LYSRNDLVRLLTLPLYSCVAWTSYLTLMGTQVETVICALGLFEA